MKRIIYALLGFSTALLIVKHTKKKPTSSSTNESIVEKENASPIPAPPSPSKEIQQKPTTSSENKPHKKKKYYYASMPSGSTYILKNSYDANKQTNVINQNNNLSKKEEIEQPTPKQNFDVNYYQQTGRTKSTIDESRGISGEYHLGQLLERMPGNKKLLYNVVIPNFKGYPPEADIILLHENGVYVFEMKNYAGYVDGDNSERYWVQHAINSEGEAYERKFKNPIRQVARVIAVMKNFVGKPIRKKKIHSFVVFPDDCELNITKTDTRTEYEYNHVVHVCEVLDTLDNINKEDKSTNRALGKEGVQKIYDTLKTYAGSKTYGNSRSWNKKVTSRDDLH